jgi:hypothetical protein
MRKIQKTISLEPMTSRMPSVWPAYMDNKLYFFDDESLKERGYLYPSNYGMIPMSVVFDIVYYVDDDESFSSDTEVSAITMAKEIYEQRRCETDEQWEERIKTHINVDYFNLSFTTISEWYYFFKEYYHLLNDYGHCDMVYSSAMDYYNHESGNKYADQMIYGVDKQVYEDLDNTFYERGGEVEITESGANDVGFYKWICDNIVPSYYISNEYADYWNEKKLYYPDVIKWIAWFESRLNYESFYTAATDTEIAHWDCKQENVDCCDCEEYFNRGGEREYNRMVEWYETLQTNITDNNAFILEHRECFEPSMIGEIELQNSIEDLGQFSIFSKEYELGIDYRTVKTEVVSSDTKCDETRIHFDAGNTNSGTVVNYEGKAMILQPDRSGFCFSRYYMDKVYDESAWSSYTDLYMKDNESEFLSTAFTYYAYDEYGNLYTTTEEDNEDALCALTDSMSAITECPIITSNSILINGTLIPVQKSEFGTYDESNQYIGEKEFFVYREKETSTPYTLINGKKIYADLYTQSGTPFYYFTFFKISPNIKESECSPSTREKNVETYKHFPRVYNGTGNTMDTKEYIVYDNVIHEVEDSGVTINDINYPHVDGYAYNADNEIMYIISGVVYDSELIGEVSNAQVDTEKNAVVIGINKTPIIYSAKEITGQTISKLSDLALTNTLVDDIGNKIDGRYNQIIFEGDSNVNDVAMDKYALIVNGVLVSLYDTPEKAKEAAPTSNFSIKKCSPAANHQPPQGKELDLLYEVGNTSNIKRFSLTESANTATTNYFVGNIITDMVFYYKDIEGNVVDATRKSWDISSLETIHRSQDARKVIEENPNSTVIFDGEDIYCDVTYYIGATLKKTQDTTFELAYDEIETSDNYNYGVEYKETVKFVKENREYHVRKQIKKQIPTKMNSVSAHSISYPIYVYNLVQEIAEIDTDSYNTLYRAPLATFKTEINLIGKNGNNLRTNYDKYLDMDNLNGIHVYPTFREEYMVGISTMENIDSDIYIERGINAAFEKHLKLGEVRTLEALLQYGNSYFKIMNN